MEFDFISTNSDILPLNSSYKFMICKLGSRPFHILMQQGKMKTGKFWFCELSLQDVFDPDDLVLRLLSPV